MAGTRDIRNTVALWLTGLICALRTAWMRRRTDEKHEGGILPELGSVRDSLLERCARRSNRQHLLEQFPYQPLC